MKVSKETISDTRIYNSFQNFVKWKKSIVLKRIFIICSIVIFFIKDGYSQKIEKSLWHGFEKESFSVGSRNAYIVKPVHALPGNPWVWRASFPDWHTDMDSILLSKGFYIAYLSVDDQYGSPQSLQVWNQFYRYLTTKISLTPRVALEAVSRGALYAYG